MNVLLSTSGTPKQGAARVFFYELADILREQGVAVSLNAFDRPRYDIAIVHWARPEAILQVLNHSPDCHIGIHSPANALKPEIRDNCDFLVVNGFMWEETLLRENKPALHTFDFPSPGPKALKRHANDGRPLMIGYCGNPVHYADEFFPHGARALQRLAREHDFVFRVITNGVDKLPAIPGVKVDLREWELDTHEDLRFAFDIGVCPSFRDLDYLKDWKSYIRDSNRVRSLLFHSIPSVTSPVFQAVQDLRHGEHVFFAFTEEGWYRHLKNLLADAALRQRIGDAGRAHVERHFSREQAGRHYQSFFAAQLARPRQPKSPDRLRRRADLTGSTSWFARKEGPWRMRHPKPADAVVVAAAGRTGASHVGLALGATPRCLGYHDPFDTRPHPAFASPYRTPYLAPDEANPFCGDLPELILSGRILEPAHLLRARPRDAQRVAVDTACGNLLLGWLHRRYGCRVHLVVRPVEVEVAARMQAGDAPALDDLLAQPALVARHLEPFLPALRAAATTAEQHAARWCVEHLVPLREVPASHLTLVHTPAWDADPAAGYERLTRDLGWPVSPRTSAWLRAQPAPTVPPLSADDSARVRALVRALSLHTEARLFPA